MPPFLRPATVSHVLIAGSLIGFAPAIGGLAPAPAGAQEPLFLRIRPAGEAPADLGSAGPSDEEIARAARARSEAVWQRAEERSRIAIASVCTGCLKAPRPAETSTGPAPRPPVRPDGVEAVPATAGTPAANLPPLAQAVAP